MLTTRCQRGAPGLTVIQGKYGQADRVCGAEGHQRGHALNGLRSPQTIYSRSATAKLGFLKTSPRWACPFLLWLSETPHSYAHPQSALCSASSNLGALQSQKGGAGEGARWCWRGGSPGHGPRATTSGRLVGYAACGRPLRLGEPRPGCPISHTRPARWRQVTGNSRPNRVP